MAAAAEAPGTPTTDLPPWLAATWYRSYIRRARPPSDGAAIGALGERQTDVSVRYLQTLAGGHAFDLRIAESFALPEEVERLADLSQEHLELMAGGALEAFAGVTTSELSDGACVLRWHSAFCFPPQLGDQDDPQAVLDRIAAGEHETSDAGRAVPDSEAAGPGKLVPRWLEHAPDGSYEEEWLLLEDYRAHGAHLAALRPATAGRGMCWLAILGNTFAYVCDIDRGALGPACRNRPIAEVLADSSIPLSDKQRAMDAEFSFGSFGQGGGVGGVVERSTLPWRRGVALAALLAADSASGADAWVPVRPSDAAALAQALAAILGDHQKACRQLREAEAEGQAGVAEVLRARGAVA